MQIIENSENRLVMRDRSIGMGLVLATGAGLWVVSVVGVVVTGALDLGGQVPPPSFFGMRLVGLALMLALALFFAGVVGMTALRVLRGTICAFDRTQAQVTITRPTWRRHTTHTYPIYGVSHAMIESNDELHLYAVHLVLRSGERVVLGVFNPFEQPLAEQIVQEVRAFLKTV